MPLTIGETFAGYRVLRLLGSGGMGEVYLTQHPRLPREDALKVLRPDVFSDTSFRERFNREADLAAGLRHPNIVGVHDRGEHNGQLWITMDYIDGPDTAQLLEQEYPTGMPIALVMHIVTAVASALDYAHMKGLLHRDVKPANIIVADRDTQDLSVFLADFGIARPLDDTGGVTTTNMTVGTVAYAAPEQLMGQPLDERADQYALAATTYHLLTGLQLFPHSNPAVVIGRHLNAEPPSMADVCPDLASLDPVLAVALAKHPETRFADCAEFARALSRAAQITAEVASPAPTAPAGAPPTQAKARSQPDLALGRVRRSPRALLAAGTILVIVSAIVALTLWTRSHPHESTAGTTPSPELTEAQQSSAATQTGEISDTTQVATSTPSPVPETPDGRYALPACYGKKDSRNIIVEPSGTAPLCRFHWYDGMEWTAWTSTRADGTGFQHLSNCNPSCAGGEMFDNPVQVHFSGPAHAPPDSECPDNFLYYTQLVVAYPSSEPPPEAEARILDSHPVATQYNGMPAYRWNNLTPFCKSLGPLDQ